MSLLGGPAVVLLALAGAPSSAAVVAGLGAVAAGRYDDVAGARAEQRADKGFAGHLRALRAGRVSAGAVKVAGIGATALLARVLDRARERTTYGWRGAVVVLRDAALVAASANLVNLLDLRPGRALKVVTLVGGLGAATAGPAGRRRFGATALAALVALPADVGERTMLGDAGANGLGALLGVAAVQTTRPAARTILLVGVLALTVASEQVSFSAVIDRTPPLAWLDRLGRG
ncbi:MAG: hypothetical protein QOG60_2599 [Frankiaceae bacterium]|nr:hypothetical protein [Frankiaceae bacterium]MDQ1650542.1 hypothetical protein [Frankiaceae bacterium]